LNETLYNEEKLRNFLLGNVSEDERGAIEDRFLTDEDFSAQLLVVEDDLIEAYLRGQLSTPQEREQFENAFLTNPQRRKRVVAMKALIKAATAEAGLMNAQSSKDESSSLWTTLLAFLRFENVYARYALAAAAALIIFSGGAWLLVNILKQNSNTQVAYNTNTPQATPTISTASSSNDAQPKQTPPSVVNPNPNTNSPQQPKQPPAGPTLATIILRPTLVRDPGAENKKLVVSSSVKRARFQLNLERNDYKSYVVRITTVDGRSIWQGGPFYPRTKKARTFVVFSFPARLLANEDYIVELSGVSETGPLESFADYFFSVTRK
jgi:hypothetical protein